MSQDYNNIDPDDFFSETRMSFGDHIEDLRTHLIKAAMWFVVALLIGFIIGKEVLRFISRPVERELEYFHKRRQEKLRANINTDEDLKEINKASPWFQVEIPRGMLQKSASDEKLKDKDLEEPKGEVETIKLWMRYPQPLDVSLKTAESTRKVASKTGLSALSVTEGFVAYLKICFVCGFVLGSPGILWQLWKFVAAGLYPHEKKYVHLYVPFSVFLLFAGVALCEWIVIPKAIRALLWFNEWLELEPDLRFSEWLGFAILLPLVFGLAFQTPIVVLFMCRIGIVTTDDIRSKRKIIWFVMAIISAMITPQDIYSMVFLLIPLVVLLEIGIFVADRTIPPPLTEEEGENDDLIEI